MVFGLIFALMTAFVAVVIVSAANARNDAAVTNSSGLQRVPVSSGYARSTAAALNARLAAALRPEVGTDPGTLAVGVMDITTGRMAVYHPTVRFHAGSIVVVDVLAAALLRRERTQTHVPGQAARLITEMIEKSGSVPAARLSRPLGGVADLEAANRVLKLAHTGVDKAGRLRLTSTTVSDQLQLLADLTLAGSPLDAASRAYALGLMEHVGAHQPWGVLAAAGEGTKYAVTSGWLADPRLAVVDSIGMVHRDGQELLVVVLSKDNPTKGAGMARVEAAAIAAANVVTCNP
jgi:hypothetical protein